MRVVGRNPVGARVRTLQRGSERELGPWHEIVGVVIMAAVGVLACAAPARRALRIQPTEALRQG